MRKQWVQWRAGVKDLVGALVALLRLYSNPQAAIDPGKWAAALQEVQDRAAACRRAAAAVGTPAGRLAVSRTLWRIQDDAERWAAFVVSGGQTLDLGDPDAVQRWHAPLMHPIESLALRLANKKDIDLEMEDAQC